MMPPLITVGSKPPASSSAATIEVVVVLPWVPAMATQLFKPHQLGQHFGAAHDRQPLGARRDQFRIVGFDRRGDDHDVGAVKIVGGVPDRDLHALFAQPLDVGALGLIGALHRVAEVDHHLGDAAHADAADADEMHRADVERQFHGSP